MTDQQDNKPKDETERRNSDKDRRLNPADRRGNEREDATDAERRRDEKRRGSE